MGYVDSITISVEDDGTTRDNVPDYLIHMAAIWVNNSGSPHTFSEDRYLLLQFNWLVNNHPQEAKRFFKNLVYQIERIRQGIDDVSAL